MRRLPVRRGFTLIELLVVIAIISVITAIVLPSLSAARGKARNARRLTEVTELRSALALYAVDNNGSYPTAAASCIGVPTGSKCWNGYILNGGAGTGIAGNTALNTLLTPYMKGLPRDPDPNRSVGDAYIYFSGTADIHCNGTDSVTGAWIAWEPETVSPVTDASCAPGNYACCSMLGCASHYFCVLKAN